MMRLFVLFILLAAALAGCTDTTDEPGSDPGADTGGADGASGSATSGGDGTSGPASSGAGGGQGSSGQGSTGSVSLFLKDAPEDTFAEVWINITAATVHLAGNETNGCTGWTTVQEENLSIELLSTAGGLAAFLGEVDLPADCKVTQIRLNASSAHGVPHEGANETISLVNGVLKIARSFNVTQDAETRVVVDIDLEKSLKKTGGPNGHWKLTPVIGKTTVEVVDDASSGEEAGEPGDNQDTPEAG